MARPVPSLSGLTDAREPAGGHSSGIQHPSRDVTLTPGRHGGQSGSNIPDTNQGRALRYADPFELRTVSQGKRTPTPTERAGSLRPCRARYRVRGAPFAAALRQTGRGPLANPNRAAPKQTDHGPEK